MTFEWIDKIGLLYQSSDVNTRGRTHISNRNKNIMLDLLLQLIIAILIKVDFARGLEIEQIEKYQTWHRKNSGHLSQPKK